MGEKTREQHADALRNLASLLEHGAQGRAVDDVSLLRDAIEAFYAYAGNAGLRMLDAWAKLTEERDAAVKRAEQAETQLAGCGAEVVKIRRELEALREHVLRR